MMMMMCACFVVHSAELLSSDSQVRQGSRAVEFFDRNAGSGHGNKDASNGWKMGINTSSDDAVRGTSNSEIRRLCHNERAR